MVFNPQKQNFYYFYIFCVLYLQRYLKSVNELLGELQGKNVGVFAVCGQPKGEVDLMMSEHNLNFKVERECNVSLFFF